MSPNRRTCQLVMLMAFGPQLLAWPSPSSSSSRPTWRSRRTARRRLCRFRCRCWERHRESGSGGVGLVRVGAEVGVGVVAPLDGVKSPGALRLGHRLVLRPPDMPLSRVSGGWALKFEKNQQSIFLNTKIYTFRSQTISLRKENKQITYFKRLKLGSLNLSCTINNLIFM